MNEPTNKEMMERFDEIKKWFPRYQSPALQERRDAIDEAIRTLIEQDKPKVTKEFVEKWVQIWMQDDADFLRRELLKMLQEAGLEANNE